MEATLEHHPKVLDSPKHSSNSLQEHQPEYIRLGDIFYTPDTSLEVGFCKNPVRLQGMERERFIQEFSGYYITHNEDTNGNITLSGGYKKFKEKFDKLLSLAKNNPHNIDYFESIFSYIHYIISSVGTHQTKFPIQHIKRDFGKILSDLKVFERLLNGYFEGNEQIETYIEGIFHIRKKNTNRILSHIHHITTFITEIQEKDSDQKHDVICQREIPINFARNILDFAISQVEGLPIETQYTIFQFIIHNTTFNQLHHDNINRISSQQKRIETDSIKYFIISWQENFSLFAQEDPKKDIIKFIQDFKNSYKRFLESTIHLAITSQQSDTIKPYADYNVTKSHIIQTFKGVEGKSFRIVNLFKEIYTDLSTISKESLDNSLYTNLVNIHQESIEIIIREKESLKQTFLKKFPLVNWNEVIQAIIGYHLNIIQTIDGLNYTHRIIPSSSYLEKKYKQTFGLLQTYKEEMLFGFQNNPDWQEHGIKSIRKILSDTGLELSHLEANVPSYIIDKIKELGYSPSIEDGGKISGERITEYGLRYIFQEDETLLQMIQHDINNIYAEEDTRSVQWGLIFKTLTRKGNLNEEELILLERSFSHCIDCIKTNTFFWDAKNNQITNYQIEFQDFIVSEYCTTLENNGFPEKSMNNLFQFSLSHPNIQYLLQYSIDYIYKIKGNISSFMNDEIKRYFLSFLNDGTLKSEDYYHVLTHIFLQEQDYEKTLLYSTYLTKEQLVEIQPQIDELRRKHSKQIKDDIKVIAEIRFIDEKREEEMSEREILHEAKSAAGFPTNTLPNNLILKAAREAFEELKQQTYQNKHIPLTQQERSGDAVEERFQKGNIYEKVGLLLTNIISPEKDIMYQYGERVKIGIPDIKLKHSIVDLKLGNNEANIVETIEKYQYIIQSILSNDKKAKEKYPKLNKLLIMTLSNNGDLRDNILKNYSDKVKFHGFEKILRLLDYTIQKEQTSEIQQSVGSRLQKFIQRKHELANIEFTAVDRDKRKRDHNQILQQITEEEKSEITRKKNALHSTHTQRSTFIQQLRTFQEIVLHQKKDLETLQRIEYIAWDIAKDYILSKNKILQEALNQERNFSRNILFQKRDILTKYISGSISYEYIKKNPLFKTLQEKIETQGMCLVKEDEKFIYKPIPKNEKFHNPFIKRDRSQIAQRLDKEEHEKREKRSFEERGIDSHFEERVGPKRIGETLRDCLYNLESTSGNMGNPRVVFHINEITQEFMKIYENTEEYINQATGKSYENKSPQTILKMLLSSNLGKGKSFQKYDDGYFSIHYEQTRAQYIAKGISPEKACKKEISLIEQFRQEREHLSRKQYSGIR